LDDDIQVRFWDWFWSSCHRPRFALDRVGELSNTGAHIA